MVPFVNRVKELAEENADKFELKELPDIIPTTHYLHIKPAKAAKGETSELVKFRKAYKYAADNLKLADENNWVDLSVIKDVLKLRYKEYDPHVYSGTKYSKLTRVVEIMIADYPNVIELNPNKKPSQIRFNR